MGDEDQVHQALSNLRKRRGVVRASITRLGHRLRELEDSPDHPEISDHAQQLLSKVNSYDNDFKTLHLELVDLITVDEEEELRKEQAVLDKFDDDIADFSFRLKKLISSPQVPATTSKSYRASSRKLQRLERNLKSVEEELHGIPDGMGDVSLLEQHREQLVDFKKELAAVYDQLSTLDLDDEDDLIILHSQLEKLQFDCSYRVKKISGSHDPTPSTTPGVDGKGVKLPKIEVPTFDGDILNWKQFWEQFSVSIHDRTHLSNAEKLVYLQHSIKDGAAKSSIEGLSQSGDHYAEAVRCLQSRYDRPRLIHRAHVRMIVDAPPLKDGSGRELRRLHDAIQQHVRALQSMDCEPSGKFITSIIELKLDVDTMFEWQKHSQASAEVPHYQDLLDFIDLRAQASETSLPTPFNRKHGKNGPKFPKPVASFNANSDSGTSRCVVCETERHPLYACPKFKSFTHDTKLSTLRKHNLCMNCLGSGHFIKECKSSHRCKRCQRPHHTIMHVDSRNDDASRPSSTAAPANSRTLPQVTSNAAVKLKSSSLLMTCRVLVTAPDGSSVETRALLDNASSASFVSERLAQSLCLRRGHQSVRVSGIAGSSPRSPIQSVASFTISTPKPNGRKFAITAIVLPRVTCDLPIYPVPFESQWTHLADLPLADPDFGHPGRIDILLGVDVFVDVLLHGRRSGPPDSPVAFETEFGWVLCGSAERASPPDQVNLQAATFHTSITCGCDDILRRFWEIEESPTASPVLTLEERSVMHYFSVNHRRTQDGKFMVPLPRKQDAKQIGESRSQAVRRFLSLERSLNAKSQFSEFEVVMREYFDLGHAEPVPVGDMDKPPADVFYLPMHAVYKSSSTTTKIRAVFDASARSATGVSLNDTLLVGPTVHSSLIDVILRFRLHRVALTTDVSKMYRAVLLSESDKDLHRFVWRSNSRDSLRDYRMTRLTFGVSASSFIANMAVKQNALDFASDYPLAAKVVEDSFYVDDGLTGADSVTAAIKLRNQLQSLFGHGGFLLRKWNSNVPAVLEDLSSDLRESQEIHPISDVGDYTKTLGLEWNTTTDQFRLTISKLPAAENVTKRVLVSDVSKVFDVLGWFAPATISMKILLQRVWELKVDWDEPVPQEIQSAWAQWRSELPALSSKDIPRCHFPVDVNITSIQIHGFSDASESAYGGVVYLRMVDASDTVHISMVMAKTKVSPIKRLTIPRLELCGALVLARLLQHAKDVFQIPLLNVYAWTDSTIVLNWLSRGNPRRFKTYVGNRISSIIEQIPPDRWNHVAGSDNPADCASRGLLPSELLEHELWWNGPPWLYLESSQWPKQAFIGVETPPEEEVALATIVQSQQPILSHKKYSTFARLQRVTAWILRFVRNCRVTRNRRNSTSIVEVDPLTTVELAAAERYWVVWSQLDNFSAEVASLKTKSCLSKNSCLLPLHPFLDSEGVLRVGGRRSNSKMSFSQLHPAIIHGKNPLTRLLIHSEHLRMLHAGPTLLSSSISRRFHVICLRKTVRSVTRQCIICRRQVVKPQPQMFGQLPLERITPGCVFERVGVDYAGPLPVKYGMVRKTTIVKAYICVFVSLAVKAVHLEAVSDLTTEAFLAALRRFMARRGHPSLIWSDNGSNFVGAKRELKELYEFLSQQKSQGIISDFCAARKVEWKCIPERAPHFGGLWEAVVKSTKTHLKRVVGDVKLTYEELSTVLAQIEACLNSRPLIPLNSPDDDGLEALTPGHFLVGQPLCALPDSSLSYRSVSLLRRWHLCQNLVRDFWRRWSDEYLCTLNKFNKWHHKSRNISVGDLVIVREDGTIPTKWPLARVTQVHPGRDDVVRVVTIRTAKGEYKRPVNKVALLLSEN